MEITRLSQWFGQWEYSVTRFSHETQEVEASIYSLNTAIVFFPVILSVTDCWFGFWALCLEMRGKLIINQSIHVIGRMWRSNIYRISLYTGTLRNYWTVFRAKHFGTGQYLGLNILVRCWTVLIVRDARWRNWKICQAHVSGLAYQQLLKTQMKFKSLLSTLLKSFKNKEIFKGPLTKIKNNNREPFYIITKVYLSIPAWGHYNLVSLSFKHD